MSEATSATIAMSISGVGLLAVLAVHLWELLKEEHDDRVRRRKNVEASIGEVQIALHLKTDALAELKTEIRYLETITGMRQVDPGEESAFIQDIRKHPRDVGSHLRYADWLEAQGRDDEGMDMRKRAARLTNPKLFVKPEKVLR